MIVAPARDHGMWHRGCAADMPGAGVDGADEVKDGHDGLTGTRKAPIASRARTEVEGTCRLAVLFVNGLMGTQNAPRIAGRARTEVEGACYLAAVGANARKVFIDGLMGTLMMMVSPVEKMVDLVPIGGCQGW